MITNKAFAYKFADDSIPIIDYNENEKQVWKYCYNRLKELYKTNACEEFNWTIN
jgi:phenylalanine-4-hydroxylase